jgi:hypothetical protein
MCHSKKSSQAKEKSPSTWQASIQVPKNAREPLERRRLIVIHHPLPRHEKLSSRYPKNHLPQFLLTPCLWVLEARKEAWWSWGATHCSDGLGYDFPLSLGRIPSTLPSNTLHTYLHTRKSCFMIVMVFRRFPMT